MAILSNLVHWLTLNIFSYLCCCGCRIHLQLVAPDYAYKFNVSSKLLYDRDMTARYLKIWWGSSLFFSATAAFPCDWRLSLLQHWLTCNAIPLLTWVPNVDTVSQASKYSTNCNLLAAGIINRWQTSWDVAFGLDASVMSYPDAFPKYSLKRIFQCLKSQALTSQSQF